MINSTWLVMALHWVHSLLLGAFVGRSHQHLGQLCKGWAKLNRCSSQLGTQWGAIPTCQPQSVGEVFFTWTVCQKQSSASKGLLLRRSMDLLGSKLSLSLSLSLRWRSCPRQDKEMNLGVKLLTQARSSVAEHAPQADAIRNNVWHWRNSLELFHCSVRSCVVVHQEFCHSSDQQL